MACASHSLRTATKRKGGGQRAARSSGGGLEAHTLALRVLKFCVAGEPSRLNEKGTGGLKGAR